MDGQQKTAVIIGGGPAGLTAAWELLERTDIHPIVLERDPQYVGGISRTVEYHGNRIDIGGHRFFSKSDRVMRWWSDMLPVAAEAEGAVMYRGAARLTAGLRRAGKEAGENVMLVRPRKSRIMYGGDLYEYPLSLSVSTLRKLGFVKLVKIGVTYVWAALFPRKEKTLEDFFINRFGSELYKTFFKSYTEKVWGVPCAELSASWGAQRVKGLSITKALGDALSRTFSRATGRARTGAVETSLIEQFLYPTKGPGFMWETVAKKIQEKGGEVRLGVSVSGIAHKDGRVISVGTRTVDGIEERIPADYVFSTTDIKALVAMLEPSAPDSVREVARSLPYRSFITVGLLLEKPPEERGVPMTDTWLYVHEPNVVVGRVQLFHNWSPYLVADPSRGWIGLEYFCDEGDALWSASDETLIERAKKETEALGLANAATVLDAVVIRVPKTYPSYTGAYEALPEVRAYLDAFPNLFLLGRNGMHRYNNQDHSMLTAMTAVDNIISGRTDKENIWAVNTEEEYHEEKK